MDGTLKLIGKIGSIVQVKGLEAVYWYVSGSVLFSLKFIFSLVERIDLAALSTGRNTDATTGPSPKLLPPGLAPIL